VPSSAIGRSLRACPGVYLGAYSECTWEHFESLLECVSQAGWECAIESNWERIVRQAGAIECNQVCTSERTWEHAMKCIWQLAFKFAVCSVMYSMCSAMYGIQRTKSHAYHSNQLNT